MRLGGTRGLEGVLVREAAVMQVAESRSCCPSFANVDYSQTTRRLLAHAPGRQTPTPTSKSRTPEPQRCPLDTPAAARLQLLPPFGLSGAPAACPSRAPPPPRTARGQIQGHCSQSSQITSRTGRRARRSTQCRPVSTVPGGRRVTARPWCGAVQCWVTQPPFVSSHHASGSDLTTSSRPAPDPPRLPPALPQLPRPPPAI
jgi:hypothetical protein